MFEEVKEMIDSTIYTNGRGEVTAKNLNLGMHAIVDATEEGLAEVKGDVTALGKRVDEIAENGTGGDVAYVYVPFENQLSDVQIEENKKSYVKILNGADLKVNIIGSICNAECYRIESGAITFGVIAHVVAENSSGASFYHESLLCILSNDGTVIVDAVDDYNTPASSGSLRVWANNLVGLENTEEQTAENINTFNTLFSGEHASVLVCAEIEEFVPEAGYVGKQTMTTPVRAVVIDIKSQDSNLQGVAMYFGNTDTDGIGLLPDGTVEPFSEEQPTEYEFYIPEDNSKVLDSDFIAKNKAFYDGAVVYSTFTWDDTDVKIYLVKSNGMERMFITPINTKVSGGMTFLYFKGSTLKQVSLTPEGTVSVEVLASAPASNGPLRVWINEMTGGENNSEQVAENAETFKAMWNETPQMAILCAAAGLGGFPMMMASPVVVYRLISENGEDMISMAYRDIIDQGNGLEIMETYVYLKQDGTVTIEY